jgi:hypothetical protein
MSWSSLFSFSNPNGEIGKSYTATGVALATLVGPTADTTIVQNLASFTSLPVGVYSVSISIPLVNTAGTTSIAESWLVGASLASNNATFTFGSKAIATFPTAIASAAATPILSTDFLLYNVGTNSTAAPIYINSSFTSGAVDNTILSFNGTATIVAVKIA